MALGSYRTPLRKNELRGTCSAPLNLTIFTGKETESTEEISNSAKLACYDTAELIGMHVFWLLRSSRNTLTIADFLYDYHLSFSLWPLVVVIVLFRYFPIQEITSITD